MTSLLFRRIDATDDVEVERVVREAVRRVLSAPPLAADRLPDGQCEWLEGFLRRCVESALLDVGSDSASADLDGLWSAFSADLVSRGIVPAILGMLRLAQDGDDKEERRGQVRYARDLLDRFLRDPLDLHHVTASAAATRDPELWRRYPAWFGGARPHDRRGSAEQPATTRDEDDAVAIKRAAATRWLVLIGGDDRLLRELLSDAVPEVRFHAAIRLARLHPGDPDSEVLRRLREAADDERWIWSARDHFATLRRGCDEARSVLDEWVATPAMRPDAPPG